ncbi:MAG: sigma-54 dependent transcriptional regulator [Desulfuromonadaceae bacterium]|nr:sigma-54 dependent transcriptional regulator [Desulfuromonadaceae bacterium]
MFTRRILAVDDEPTSRLLLEEHLSQNGYNPITASDGAEALNILAEQQIDLIVTDLFMPGISGIELIDRVRKQHGSIPIILITGKGSIESAVAGMRAGAYDFLEKPYNPENLRCTIQRALDYRHLVVENEQIKCLLNEQYSFQSIVTVNLAMKKVLELAKRVVAAPDTTIAIYGESGCGKEVLARAIHVSGKGLPAAFVAVNCAAIPEHLLESELFGHVRGAFTGADSEREGKFSLARGGTILLDEIGDMPLPLQAKLLRVIQERVFEKIGSNTPISVNCRIIVATNRNLAELVAAGRFREDLYYRISVFPLSLPPLRERKDDIPPLCEFLLDKLRQHLGKHLPGISQEAMESILAYHWPGNVRELRNCLERAAILTDGELIRSSHLGFASSLSDVATDVALDDTSYILTLPPDNLSLDALTDQILAITLDRCNGNKSKAAKLLRIGRKAFYRS